MINDHVTTEKVVNILIDHKETLRAATQQSNRLRMNEKSGLHTVFDRLSALSQISAPL